MSGIKNNVRRTRKRISDSKKVLMILGLLINTMTAVADDSIKEMFMILLQIRLKIRMPLIALISFIWNKII